MKGMSTHARMDMRKHSFNPESASKKPNFHSDSTHQMRFRVLRNRRANPSIHRSKAHSPASSTPRPISIVQSSEPAISPSTGAYDRLYKAVVQAQCRHDGLVPLASFLELSHI